MPESAERPSPQRQVGEIFNQKIAAIIAPKGTQPNPISSPQAVEILGKELVFGLDLIKLDQKVSLTDGGEKLSKLLINLKLEHVLDHERSIISLIANVLDTYCQLKGKENDSYEESQFSVRTKLLKIANGISGQGAKILAQKFIDHFLQKDSSFTTFSEQAFSECRKALDMASN